jgi:hypothetical protein
VVPSLIGILIYLMEYCYVQCVSYREDETKEKELSHPEMFLEKGENFEREMR